MTTPSPPPFLSIFQRHFSQMLRTPLTSASGTFEPVVASYAADLCGIIAPPAHGGGVRERLLIYNRQYWLRLFSALQTEYPLTAYLMGYWVFNHYVQGFLMGCPPIGADLGQAADGFLAYLAEAGEVEIPVQPRRQPLPRTVMLQAAQIDETWRRVFQAREETPWRAAGSDATRLPKLRLEAAATFALIEENWPLMALRRAVNAGKCECAEPLPIRLEKPQFWVLTRTAEGIQQLSIHPLQACLLKLVQTFPLEEALPRIEENASPSERDLLAANVGAWLAQSMHLGFWRGTT